MQTSRRSLPRLALLTLPITALLLGGRTARGQAQAPPPPPYPHTNESTWYQVDPRWPQRPPECKAGITPGIAVDGKDQVWVYSRATPPVQVYTTDGKFVRAWGEKEINSAHHIEIAPDGNVWVADIGHHVIMQFTPEGKLLKTLGTKDEPGEDQSHLNKPTDMAIAPSGEVFVSDGYGNNRIVHFDRNGRFVKAWGKLGTAPGDFSIPHAIAMDSRGRLYVADRNNARVQVFDQSGKLLGVWKDLILPWGLWVTKADEIWVCGSTPMPWIKGQSGAGTPPKDQVFMKFSPEGKVLQVWGVPKGVDGQEKPGDLNWVHCVAFDSQGNLYAGDIQGQRAQKFVRHVGGEAPAESGGVAK